MKPKLNKLITLLMLLSTFTFLMEIEERVSPIAKKELSKWVSLLPISSTALPSPQDATQAHLFASFTKTKAEKEDKETASIIN